MATNPFPLNANTRDVFNEAGDPFPLNSATRNILRQAGEDGNLNTTTAGAPQDGTQTPEQLRAQAATRAAEALRNTPSEQRRGSATSPVSPGQGNAPAANAGSRTGAVGRLTGGTNGKIPGVGAALTEFKLAVAEETSAGTFKASSKNYIRFEMAPARRSTVYDKSGPQTPGAGSGLDSSFQLSLAKLKVPGGRPIYQSMGIAGETISFVGAFIGFDEYYGDYSRPEFDNQALNTISADALASGGTHVNAMARARELFRVARMGAQVILTLGFSSDQDESVKFDSVNEIRGYLHKVSVAYSTAQRVYYQVVLEVTNREDLLRAEPSGDRFYKLPPKILSSLTARPLNPGESALTGRAQEAQALMGESALPTNVSISHIRDLVDARRLSPYYPRVSALFGMIEKDFNGTASINIEDLTKYLQEVVTFIEEGPDGKIHSKVVRGWAAKVQSNHTTREGNATAVQPGQTAPSNASRVFVGSGGTFGFESGPGDAFRTNLVEILSGSALVSGDTKDSIKRAAAAAITWVAGERREADRTAVQNLVREMTALGVIINDNFIDATKVKHRHVMNDWGKLLSELQKSLDGAAPIRQSYNPSSEEIIAAGDRMEREHAARIAQATEAVRPVYGSGLTLPGIKLILEV